ncbi:MAG: MFS transporter [Actinobacteria bacterium]|nr:MFS transporter [Actinomycetota bacterium]
MKNVILLGLVSFFIDLSTDMVYPLVPLYLTSTLGATPGLVGLIEGIAESLASLLRVFSGHISDKYHKKKPLAFIGYSASLLYKLALLLATSWFGILAARVIDRIGKGIRTAPRDVLVCESSEAGSLGKSFGIHKALDMAGSGLGILLAFLFLEFSHGTGGYKMIFLVSIIPAVLGLFMFPFIRETSCRITEKTPLPTLSAFRSIDSQLKVYLLVAFLFTLGNSSNAFLLLRAQSVGFSDSTAVLLYFIYHVSASLLAIPLGRLSDTAGRKKLLVTGYIAFSLVYFGFAFAENGIGMVLIFTLYGAYTAMVAGVERAYISEISPPELKGTMLGLHSTIVGIALLPASLIAGLLWNYLGPQVPFIFGASMALLAALILGCFMRKRPLYAKSL